MSVGRLRNSLPVSQLPQETRVPARTGEESKGWILCWRFMSVSRTRVELFALRHSTNIGASKATRCPSLRHFHSLFSQEFFYVIVECTSYTFLSNVERSEINRNGPGHVRAMLERELNMRTICGALYSFHMSLSRRAGWLASSCREMLHNATPHYLPVQ